MPKRITVIVSQGQSANPAKRRLEEEIVGSLLGESGVEVTIVPHLYDLAADSTGMLCLAGITGDMIVCSWLYPRAAQWTLDRNGILGREGKTLIRAYGEDEDDDESEENSAGKNTEQDEKQRVVDQRPTPSRTIYCLDLRTEPEAKTYLAEIRRILSEATVQTVQLGNFDSPAPSNGQAKNGQAANVQSTNGQPFSSHPTNGQASPADTPFDNSGGFATPSGPIKLSFGIPPEENGSGANTNGQAAANSSDSDQPAVVEETPPRRWYPVIDFGRCTNCMECIDFCLFGVYGLDGAETILVEQPDNCRKGCPACSRVCPENAIIFPQHKTPTIAGSPEVGGPMKIDLSKLFGAPDPGAPGADKAFDVAARERDEQLLIAGRDAVGIESAIPKRQPTTQSNQPKDELDQLMDELDEIDL